MSGDSNPFGPLLANVLSDIDEIWRAPLSGAGAIAAIPHGELRRPDGAPNYTYIRSVYAAVMPDIVEAADRWIDPYFVDWVSIFTPIESAMWSVIRSQATPYYPQMPVGGYIVDFGNPLHRIAIECDGRAWHDAKRDEARDAQLGELGWRVFRFSGRACLRMPSLPDLRAWATGCTTAESEDVIDQMVWREQRREAALDCGEPVDEFCGP